MNGEHEKRDAATLEREPEDMERVFQQHHALVFRAAYRITGNAADAEDVMQTVFLRLVRRGGMASEVGVAEHYLRRAAVNGALDVVRARAGARWTPLEAAAPVASRASDASPERMAASAEIRAWLREAVARLSAQAGEIFALRYFEGRETDEVAQMVGTTPATVAVTLHRSRERLEREFRAWTGDKRHD